LGRTVSPITPRRQSDRSDRALETEVSNAQRGRLVFSLLHLSSPETVTKRDLNIEIQPEIASNAPPLAGSLPFGVRTFLSFACEHQL